MPTDEKTVIEVTGEQAPALTSEQALRAHVAAQVVVAALRFLPTEAEKDAAWSEVAEAVMPGVKAQYALCALSTAS